MSSISNLIRIGNSSGIIIPAKMLKALSLSGRDTVALTECQGGILLKKATQDNIETPFSALDRWNEEHGFTADDALEYVEAIRKGRHNKDIPQW